jgi:serine/threonine-protein kinase HipA
MAAQERMSVWMYGRCVATLTKVRERLSLSYTEEGQDTYDVNMPLISVSLPVGPQAFPHNKVRPFFDGLLPEGEARRMLAYDFRLQEEDTFGLIGALGRDCAGAIVVLPEGEAPPGQNARPPIPMAHEDLAVRMGQLAAAPLGVDQQVRVSLAGLQQKMVLSRLSSGEWALPINGLPSTHILKRADPRFATMVANEAFCLAVCRHAGLRVAAATIIEMPEPILVVTRYDREVSTEGEIRRIHQEDLAQALSINSSAKYEEHGGPGLRTIARLLRDWAQEADSLERLLSMTFLNMVLGNADAHAKNFSLLLHESGAVQLAPAYDIVSTALYPRVDVRPGMSVNQKISIHDITTQDVIAEATSWGMHQARATACITDLIERLPRAIRAASSDVPSVPPELVELVNVRAAAFANGLSHQFNT